MTVRRAITKIDASNSLDAHISELAKGRGA
jgi:hypothetical protein